jgi:hemin uptake protein HemP
MSMSTLSLPSLPASLPLSPTREVSRRRLSLRRVEVNPPARRAAGTTPAAGALETVKSAVAALPARLEALMRDARGEAPSTREPVALETLMQGANTLPILHNGEVYTLRITRYGKLILTK